MDIPNFADIIDSHTQRGCDTVCDLSEDDSESDYDE